MASNNWIGSILSLWRNNRNIINAYLACITSFHLENIFTSSMLLYRFSIDIHIFDNLRLILLSLKILLILLWVIKWSIFLDMSSLHHETIKFVLSTPSSICCFLNSRDLFKKFSNFRHNSRSVTLSGKSFFGSSREIFLDSSMGLGYSLQDRKKFTDEKRYSSKKVLEIVEYASCI